MHELLQEVELRSHEYSTVFTSLTPDTQYIVEVKGIVGEFESLPGRADAATGTNEFPKYLWFLQNFILNVVKTCMAVLFIRFQAIVVNAIAPLYVISYNI